MTQVVRTTNELIVNALYLTGELGVGEPADSFMLTTGLELINELLDGWSSDSIYIPFLTTIDFTFVPGQGEYTISNIGTPNITGNQIVDLSFANYEVPTTGSTRLSYPLRIISKAEYYNVWRQTNVQTRPIYVFLNKQATESIVTVYPLPDQPYECKIQVKSYLNKLEAQDTLAGLPPLAYGLLKYALARKFIAYYPSANWPQMNEAEYERYFQMFKNFNETDLTIRPSEILATPGPYYWQNIFSYGG